MGNRDAINAVVEAYVRQAFSRASQMQSAEMQQWLYANEHQIPETIRGVLFQTHNTLVANRAYADQAD